MAATAMAIRYTVNQNVTPHLRTTEVDVEHLPTVDTQAAVETAALAHVRKWTDLRGVTPTRVATSYQHTTFTSGSTSMRRSTVTYQYN